MIGDKEVKSMVRAISWIACLAWVPVAAPTLAADGSTDTIETEKGPLEIIPVNHATFVLKNAGKVVYVDPVGGKEAFGDLPAPDLILLTDIHGDHLSVPTLKAIIKKSTVIVASPEAAKQLDAGELGINPKAIRVLKNGESTAVTDIKIDAIPAYNTTEGRERYHPKGRGNGYVLNIATKRVYISGDTEDIPEMRALEKIDVAFLCMNLPYTMTPEAAASAVLEFRPKVVYPYHYRSGGTDTWKKEPERFKKLVEAKSKDIDVRLRDWYATE